MQATSSHFPLNDTQILLLQAFARINSSQEREDIQSLLLNYYRKKVDAQANLFHFSNETIEEILNSQI